jgi:class 3 adenylate cyclase/tetratricopeptide (TPR) repeat protein
MPVTCPECGFASRDGLKFCGACGSSLSLAGGDAMVRRIATILFADVTGSTALGERVDPESLRALMNRYFTMMRRVIEGHGGTVEKFIGDAVMAVFGYPDVHEEDALRAVRAAVDIRAALSELNVELERDRGFSIRFRTGVNTGEVVAGDPASRTTLVTGDTVNTAARLEQAAEPGDILLGRLTYSLVRDAVVAEHHEPVAAKGKSEPLEAWRLVSVRPLEAGRSRNLESPMVGRERELARLDAAYRQAVADRTCAVFTLLGAAGVGKSRLTEEFLVRVADEATILRGRCLSYGAGITYWPIAELVRGLAGVVEADAAEAARVKVRALFADASDADTLAAALLFAMGLSADAATGDDVAWAFRRLLERQAEARPVVAVIEDIHWAEPALLELVEETAAWTRDSPLVILCPGRPELLDANPTWGGGRLNATTLLLEPLAPDATSRMIEALPGGSALPPSVIERVVAAADGNPLFLEELLATFIDEGLLRQDADGAWQTTGEIGAIRVPPSISAVLAARLARLDPRERATAQRAAIVGRVFDRPGVVELTPDSERASVPPSLGGLQRKEVIRRERGHAAGEAYAFRHALIREAAYDGLAKGERAALHERFAGFLEASSGERLAELEEIVAYHLEEAYRYRTELGDPDAEVRVLAEHAAAVLEACGDRAEARTDYAAAVNLFGRSHRLTTDPVRRAEVGQRLANALFHVQRFREAIDIGQSVVDVAREAGVPGAGVHAGLTLLGARQALGEARIDELWAGVRAARAAFEGAGDHEGLRRTWMVESFLHSHEGRETESIVAAREAARHAAATGAVGKTAGALSFVADSYAFGNQPVADAIVRIEADMPTIRAVPGAFFLAAGAIATLYAMADDVDAARRYLAARDELAAERGRTRELSNRLPDGLVGLRSDDPAGFVGAVRDEYRRLVELGDDGVAQLHGVVLGELLLRTGDKTGARTVVREIRTRGTEPPPEVAASLSLLEAAVASVDGDHASALRLARDGVDRMDATEWLAERGAGWMRLAEVLLGAGDVDEAGTAARRSIDLLDQKGDAATGARARALLAEIDAASVAAPDGQRLDRHSSSRMA